MNDSNIVHFIQHTKEQMQTVSLSASKMSAQKRQNFRIFSQTWTLYKTKFNYPVTVVLIPETFGQCH